MWKKKSVEVTEVYAVENDSWGYDWAELHVYVHPANRRRFAVDSDSDCSCNYYEQPTEDELRALTPFTMADTRTEISQWLDLQGFAPDNKAREMERAHLALSNRGRTR